MSLRGFRGLLRPALAAALMLSPSLVHPARAASPPGVTLADAWMRALPGLPAAGYFSLHNAGPDGATLTGAKAAACGSLTLHQTVRMRTMSHMSGLAPGSMSGMPGMTSMHAVAAIGIAPGATVRFTPGGYHLMCEQPAASVVPGATVPIILQFADGSSLTTGFAVRKPGGR
nr:copper chaperone PCu(A)C [uncultured Lichenicoccus sp.]